MGSGDRGKSLRCEVVTLVAQSHEYEYTCAFPQVCTVDRSGLREVDITTEIGLEETVIG